MTGKELASLCFLLKERKKSKISYLTLQELEDSLLTSADIEALLVDYEPEAMPDDWEEDEDVFLWQLEASDIANYVSEHKNYACAPLNLTDSISDQFNDVYEAWSEDLKVLDLPDLKKSLEELNGVKATYIYDNERNEINLIEVEG